VNQCSPAGYPEKHTSRLYPRHKQDQLISLLSRGPGLRLNLDSKPPHLRPGLSAALRPPPMSTSNQSVRKESKPTIRVTSLPTPISKYVLRIKKICDLTTIHSNGRSSINTDIETMQPNYAPWPRDTGCYTHQYPYHIPTRSLFSFLSFYYESKNNINHLL
jgi:hypothetical protein